ncbi:hypothetical protein Hanom_Chr12g01172681 [Helianthus anomalus]
MDETMSSLEIVRALASMGAVKSAKRERVVEVEMEREDESGRILGVGLKGMRYLGEGGGGERWLRLAVAEARRAITTADEWKWWEI